MTPATSAALPRRKPRSLALELVEALGARIREGRFGPGDKLPTEAAIMVEFDVSRTVVREAISKLQASGLVETRHGIGTFVLGLGDGGVGGGFKVTPEQLGTLRDVIEVLELRLGIETEAAALAAQRRSDTNLQVMREALEGVSAALGEGRSAVQPDFQFHLEIARATQNQHYLALMSALGSSIIPRARLEPAEGMTEDRLLYLRRVNTEHENIFDAIRNQDPEAARAAMRTHLANSRERRRRAGDGA